MWLEESKQLTKILNLMSGSRSRLRFITWRIAVKLVKFFNSVT
jgi:hypothetical protein